MMISTIKHLTFSNLSKCLKCKKSETNIYGYKTNIRILCKCLTNVNCHQQTSRHKKQQRAHFMRYMCQIWYGLCAAFITDDDNLHMICQNIMHVSFVETVVLFSTLTLCDLAYIWRCIDFFKHCVMVSWLVYSIAVSNFLISCLDFLHQQSMILQIFVPCKSCKTKSIHNFFNVIKLRHQKIASQIAIQCNGVLLVFCIREDILI